MADYATELLRRQLHGAWCRERGGKGGAVGALPFGNGRDPPISANERLADRLTIPTKSNPTPQS